MELMKAMEERRSLRAFAEKPVERALVEDVIRAAGLAPSWKNSQTGRYYVTVTPEMTAKVKAECLPEFNQKSAANAPVLIVSAFEKNRSGFTREGAAENELGNGWGCYDLGLQNENLVLRAHELGLATLIMGIRDGEALRRVLSVPDSQEVVAVIALGYAAAEPQMPKRKAVADIAKFL